MPAGANEWSRSFYAGLQRDHSTVRELRDAAVFGELARWTASLTSLVADAFRRLGFDVAAKGHRCDTLPVAREEYLALDVTALAPGGGTWRFPAAVCELENSGRDEVVAYSLWKTLCVRNALRVVFCYRSVREHAPGLVSYLANQVAGALSVADRQRLHGDTLLFVGTRSEAGTFPYGFFRAWRLNKNTGRFEPFPWQE